MEDPNQAIYEFLSHKLITHQSAFTNTQGIPVIFKNLYDQLRNTNLEAYEHKIYTELKTNCRHWWTNKKEGINNAEGLDAILFEHDWYLFIKDLEANAYGIIDWKDSGTYSAHFDMGFEYDFAQNFESHPGITLTLYNELQVLDPSLLPSEMLEKDIHEYPGYQDLVSLYTFTNYITVHKALRRFVETPEFKKISRNPQFLFIIQQHDGFYSTPVWNCIENKPEGFLSRLKKRLF